jgi:predicted DCC family thiol-disulfide oxidoreductase YuxK
MQRLYVLFDDHCGLCSWARRWLAQQPAYLELSFIPASSPLASRLFPGLVRGEKPDELIVVSEDGGVYREGRAWVMCLYALQEYREWSLRLARPMLFPLARQAFALVSRRRAKISRWLNLASEVEIAAALWRVNEPPCCLISTPDSAPPSANGVAQSADAPGH